MPSEPEDNAQVLRAFGLDQPVPNGAPEASGDTLGRGSSSKKIQKRLN